MYYVSYFCLPFQIEHTEGCSVTVSITVHKYQHQYTPFHSLHYWMSNLLELRVYVSIIMCFYCILSVIQLIHHRISKHNI